MNLTEVKMGQLARILWVQESSFKEKLLEMGCVKGVLIKPVLSAPFGDPIAYELDDYTLSMRKDEAKTISVSLLGELFES